MTVESATPRRRITSGVQCRYLRRNDEMCTAEAVDPEGEALLCAKHLGRAWELIARVLPVPRPPSDAPGGEGAA